MALAVVRSLEPQRLLRSAEELDDYEQELVDQYALASIGAGVGDERVARSRAVVFELLRYLGCRVWQVRAADADRYLVWLRKSQGNAKSTVAVKAGSVAAFYAFVIARYQGEVYSLTGHVLEQPIDEHNRPSLPDYVSTRVPPRDDEVEALFEAWGAATVHARKYLTAARDYFAASLWRRVGLRINETVMLDMRDWHPELGEYGKLHVRCGKGSRGRGPKPRFVPAINEVDRLMDWWLGDVRHQFGDEWSNPDAALLPSERRDRATGLCIRAGDDTLRSSLAQAVDGWLPAWSHRLSPHGLRHYCASSYYARGMDLKAIQDVLGHEWLSTTTRYIHVHDEHIELAWAAANQRVDARLTGRAG